MKRWTRPALLLALLLLAGCGSMLVQPGPRRVDGLQLDTPVSWTERGSKGHRIWTRDGTALNALHLYTEIKPGEHVMRQRYGLKKDEGARFRAGLSAVEAQELIVDALRASGATDLKSEGLRPHLFAGETGFRFELSFANAQGLRYQAMAAGEVENGTMSWLIFLAPSGHYYERDRVHVEAILASLARR